MCVQKGLREKMRKLEGRNGRERSKKKDQGQLCVVVAAFVDNGNDNGFVCRRNADGRKGASHQINQREKKAQTNKVENMTFIISQRKREKKRATLTKTSLPQAIEARGWLSSG